MIWTYLRSCYGFNMRVWIGEEEKVYPARWYFCDPDAAYFPSPHGAEASPWLKQFETNADWGDDGAIKKLDRGINPGYPGRCSVGDPQWFIDGRLPADFLSGPQRIAPACCGYTPPLNPDPRCPPWRALVPCPVCTEGQGYDSYTVQVEGGTGDFAFLNGSWRIAYLGNCTWRQDPFTQIISMFIFGGSQVPEFFIGPVPFGPYVHLIADLPFSCLTTPLAFRYYSSVGVGNPPTITVF